MEGDEVGELKEQAEKGGEMGMQPVAFTMSVLAVMVAITTVLGHGTHTEAIIAQTKAAVEQNRASDMWAFYQAKKLRSNETALTADLLSTLAIADKTAAAKVEKGYADHQAKWADDLKEEEKAAREQEEKVKDLEQDVSKAEVRAKHFDWAEVLLEIGLVITSVTLLTRTKMYWYLGIFFSIGGILSALSVLMLK